MRWLVVSGLSLVALTDARAQVDDHASGDASDEQVVEDVADDADEVVVIRGRAPDMGEPITYELTGDELRLLPGSGNDALKALQSLPGVARVPFGMGGLALRGSSPRDTSVVLDGIEVPMLYHFGGLTSFIPSSMLAAIDLQPGSFGVAHGRARGGLVAVTSKPGRADRWRFGAELGLSEAYMRGDGPGPMGGTWSFGMRRSYADAIFQAVLPEGQTDVTFLPRYYDAQLRYHKQLSERDTISAIAFGADDRMATSDLALASRFTRVGVRWQRRAGGVRSHALAWFGTDRADIVGYAAPDDMDVPGNEQPIDPASRDIDYRRRRRASTVGVRAGSRRPLRAETSVQVGLDAQAGQRDMLVISQVPSEQPDGDDVAFEQYLYRFVADVGVWVELEHAMRARRILVRPGIRVDRYGLSEDWAFDPRITVSERLPRGIELTQSLGVYHQPPLLGDLAHEPDNVASSYSVQAALGAEMRLAGAVDVSVTAFFDRARRLPVRVTPADFGAGFDEFDPSFTDTALEFLEEQFGTVHVEPRGHGRAFGAELLVRYSSPRWFAQMAYTGSRSERRDDPAAGSPYHPYVLDQTHILTLIGSVRLGRGWRLGARARYATGRPTTPIKSLIDLDGREYIALEGEPWSGRLPRFWQLDLRVDYSWRRTWGTLAVFLDLHNATNQPNIEAYRFSRVFTRSARLRGLPIFPWFGLEYRQ